MKPASIVATFAVAIAMTCASTAFAQPATTPAPDEETAEAEPATATNENKSKSEPPTATAAARARLVPAAEAPSSAGSVETPDKATPSGPPRYDLVRINAGMRVGYVPSSAFDTFASNDVLPQFSLDGTYPILAGGRFALGVGLGWDVGGRSDKVRGFDSSLTVHRLYVPIEARLHLSPGFYVFGKVSPGALAALASTNEPSAPNDLSATGWAFSADASLGGSLLLGPRKDMDKRGVRFWLTPEIGYAYTGKVPLRGNPHRDEGDLLGTDESRTFGSLALSGLFWRASVGMTF